MGKGAGKAVVSQPKSNSLRDKGRISRWEVKRFGFWGIGDLVPETMQALSFAVLEADAKAHFQTVYSKGFSENGG